MDLRILYEFPKILFADGSDGIEVGAGAIILGKVSSETREFKKQNLHPHGFSRYHSSTLELPSTSKDPARPRTQRISCANKYVKSILKRACQVNRTVSDNLQAIDYLDVLAS